MQPVEYEMRAQMAVQRSSGDMFGLVNALCSTELEAGMVAEMQSIYSASTEASKKARERIAGAMERFQSESSTMNDKVFEFAMKVSDEIIANRSVDKKRIKHFNRLATMAEEVSQLYSETAETVITLTNRSIEGRYSKVQGAIDLTFHARMKEIESLKEKLDLVLSDPSRPLMLRVLVQLGTLKQEGALMKSLLDPSAVSEPQEEEELLREASEEELQEASRLNKEELEATLGDIQSTFHVASLNAANRLHLFHAANKTLNAEVDK